jgi:hypothetical protein
LGYGLARVLQENRIRERVRGRQEENEELAYVIMEADKPQDLQLANWRPRRANGTVSIQSTKT